MSRVRAVGPSPRVAHTDAPEVEQDLGHVLADAGDVRRARVHAGDVEGCDGGAGQSRKQDAAQGAAQRRAVAGGE